MSNRKVIIISLGQSGFFKNMCRSLLTALRERADVLEATTVETAIEHLGLPTAEIAAVLVGDPDVILPKFVKVASKMVKFARDGGTLIFGGLCSSFGGPDDFDKFFERIMSLPWKFGSCHRTTFALNPAAARHERFARHSMPNSYSMKAVHITRAAPESHLYVSMANSVVESLVFAPDPITDRTESPILFAEYGRGFVAWIGDINLEVESTAVVVAMCNL